MSDPARILVADDEQNLCRVLVARLSRDGHRAEAVHDGARALDRIRQDAYDVVFLDMRMPTLTGMDVLRQVRDERHPVAVVVMTAYDSPEAVHAALAAGADAYITKPFDLDWVAESVAGLLARRPGAARPASGSIPPKAGEA